MKPNAEVLMLISKCLNQSPDYFFRKQQVDLGAILFRKKSSLSKKDEEAVIEKARDYVERCTELESILGVFQDFHNPLEHLIISHKDDVEKAADRLRIEWNLGDNPVSNLTEMLELRGIKVLLLNEVEDIDGLSAVTSSGVPLLMVNTKDKPTERVRFTIIHELAHLLLKFSEEIAENLIEKLCHYFASCFLIPTKKLIAMIGSAKRTYIAINELILIKQHFGISLRAVLHRLSELEVIIPVYYQKWSVYLSKTYGGKKEPGDYPIAERSTLCERLINRALAEGMISMSKAASLTGIPVNLLRKGLGSVN
jgi:Zn-dependent peptidase ImmA (M78 family)